MLSADFGQKDSSPTTPINPADIKAYARITLTQATARLMPNSSVVRRAAVYTDGAGEVFATLVQCNPVDKTPIVLCAKGSPNGQNGIDITLVFAPSPPDQFTLDVVVFQFKASRYQLYLPPTP